MISERNPPGKCRVGSFPSGKKQHSSLILGVFCHRCRFIGLIPEDNGFRLDSDQDVAVIQVLKPGIPGLFIGTQVAREQAGGDPGIEGFYRGLSPDAGMKYLAALPVELDNPHSASWIFPHSVPESCPWMEYR